MTQGGNLDGSLAAIAVEINTLHTQGKGIQLALGLKLLEARELLRIKNGTRPSGRDGLDGKKPPNGWLQWTKENFPNMSYPHIRNCVQLAIDPERWRQRTQERDKRTLASLTYLKRQVRNIWPRLNEPERNEIIDLMLALQGEAA